jgi:hypothetical protein
VSTKTGLRSLKITANGGTLAWAVPSPREGNLRPSLTDDASRSSVVLEGHGRARSDRLCNDDHIANSLKVPKRRVFPIPLGAFGRQRLRAPGRSPRGETQPVAYRLGAAGWGAPSKLRHLTAQAARAESHRMRQTRTPRPRPVAPNSLAHTDARKNPWMAVGSFDKCYRVSCLFCPLSSSFLTSTRCHESSHHQRFQR